MSLKEEQVMRAAQIAAYGDASAVAVNEVERPVAGTGEVVVQIRAAALNPFDTTVRQGYVAERIPLTLPVTLGGDIAGAVTEVGENVEGLKVGDAVYGQAGAVFGASGAFAEYARTGADRVVRAPKNLDFTEAASLVLTGASALQALTDHIGLKAGQTIFIHGGGGGIGSVAIQLAKNIGARVVTTAAGENISYVKGIGADEIIDYRSQNFAEIVHGVDAVFDTVGGDDFNRSLALLKKGGIAVSMIAQADERHADELGVRAISQFTQTTPAVLDTLRELIEKGAVKPRIGKVFPLDKVVEAFTARESGLKGKVVLEMKAESE